MLLHFKQFDDDDDEFDDENDDEVDGMGDEDAELQRHEKFIVAIAESSIDESSREKFDKLFSSCCCD